MSGATVDRGASAVAAGLTTAAALLVLALAADAASAAKLRGEVVSGDRALKSIPVKVYRSGKADTTQLGRGVTDRRGRFRLRYAKPSNPDAVAYLVAGKGAGIRLAATLGAPAATPAKVVVNELTTAATGYAFASSSAAAGSPAPPPIRGTRR